MVQRACVQCGTVFDVKPSVLTNPKGGGRYCSRACSALGRTTSKRQLTCTGCGGRFSGYVRGASSYCSAPCRLSHRDDDQNPNWRGGPPSFTCEACGKSFTRYVARGRALPPRFCSVVCKGAARRKLPTARPAHERGIMLATAAGSRLDLTRPALLDPASLPRLIPGFPRYAVDLQGGVIGPRGTILKAQVSSQGYPAVTLYRDGHAFKRHVHSLAALAWRGPRPSLAHVVAHWDGDRLNAATDNLRWATHRENEADKLRHGRHHRQRLTVSQVLEIKAALQSGEVPSSIARRFLVWPHTIYKIRDGKTWATCW